MTTNAPTSPALARRAAKKKLRTKLGALTHMHASIAGRLIGEIMRDIDALPPALPVLPMELLGIQETIAQGAGFWRSCSGCHELNEGHDTGPRSQVFGCTLGNGCDECGGLGAIWDTTDYDAMADAQAATLAEPPKAAPSASAVHRVTRVCLQASITFTSRYSSTVGFKCLDAPPITIDGLTPTETDRLSNPHLFGLRIELFDPTDPKEQA